MLRVTAGLTQTELAEQLNCSYNYISYVENGKRRASVEFYISAANYFNVSLDDIFQDSISIKNIKHKEIVLTELKQVGNDKQKLLLKIMEAVAEAI